MIDRYDFQASIVAFLIAFVAAGLFAILFKVIYQWATPYHERTLIREGNVAAAITLGSRTALGVVVLRSSASRSAGVSVRPLVYGSTNSQASSIATRTRKCPGKFTPCASSPTRRATSR